MSDLIEISGQLLSNGEQLPFQVTIGTPEQEPLSGDFFCRVISEQLLSRSMSVYGVSRHQAVQLALTLLAEVLKNRVLPPEDSADDLWGDR
jgi:hypothetical protein